MFFAIFWPLHILACVFSQQFRLHARTRSRPYSRFCGKMKVLLLHCQYFFLLTRLKSKTVRCSLRYVDSFLILVCVTSNSYFYIQDECLDHILACVANYKSYARIFSVFFLLIQIKSKTATCSLRYFGPCTF